MRWSLVLVGCGRLNFGYPLAPCEETSANASVLQAGTCYTHHDTPTSWTAANSTCQTIGGVLVTIHSQEENDAVSALPVTTPTWIGMVNMFPSSIWGWSSGGPLLYSSWIAGQPMFCATGSTGGLYLPDGSWTSACVDEGHPFVCEIPPWLVDETTGHAYRLFFVDEDWFGAVSSCTTFGGYLATITSAAEHQLVSQLIGVPVWLGGSSTDGITYSWVTGEPFGPYTPWAAGEPAVTGTCVSNDEDQQWHASLCAQRRMALCERE